MYLCLHYCFLLHFEILIPDLFYRCWLLLSDVECVSKTDFSNHFHERCYLLTYLLLSSNFQASTWVYYTTNDQFEELVASMNNRGYRESALKQKLIGRRRQYQQLHEKHPGQYIILSPVRLTQSSQAFRIMLRIS